MTTDKPRPPSPEYFKKFVRQWCGGWSGARIIVTDGKRAPHIEAAGIEVGAEWLKRQAIPREALEGPQP